MRIFSLIAIASVLIGMAGGAQSQPKPDPKRAEMDRMLDALKAAPNEPLAGMLEDRIKKTWFSMGSPAATLLMSRGTRDLNNDADEEALEDFNAALVLEPGLTDGYYRRGLARAALGDFTGALADFQATLTREPRHFAALQSLSRIAEQRGDIPGALAAWEKALDLSPMTPNGAERLKALQKKAFGSET